MIGRRLTLDVTLDESAECFDCHGQIAPLSTTYLRATRAGERSAAFCLCATCGEAEQHARVSFVRALGDMAATRGVPLHDAAQLAVQAEMDCPTDGPARGREILAAMALQSWQAP